MSDTPYATSAADLASDAPPRWLPVLLRSLVVLPIVVAVVRALATGWFPVGDSALLAIRAHDVGTVHHPLLGSWTSASLTLGVDVNNPGPLYPDLLAPFQWTIGRWFGIGPATAIGVGVVNGGFALLTAWAAHRIDGWRSERFALLLVAALTWSMGSELLIDIWQPHALLLPFAAVLYLTTALIAGRWALLPWWLGVVSLVAQTHVGYVYVLTVLVVLVAVHGVVDARASTTPWTELVRGRVAVWSVAVVLLAWLQPVVEQVVGEGRGNLARLATNAGGGDVTLGGALAVKLVAQVVALPPWWTRPGFEDSIVSTPLTAGPDGPLLLVPGLASGSVALGAIVLVVIALAALWWRTRALAGSSVGSAVLVAVVCVVTAVVSLAVQTVSPVGLSSHHVRWLWVLSLFVFVTVLWAGVELVRPAPVARFATPAVAIATGLLVVANLPLTAHALGPTADRAAVDTLERTFDDLIEFDPGGPITYSMEDVRPFEPWSAAVQMRLREIGVEFRVDDEGMVRQLGNRRRADGSEVTVMRQIERSAALRDPGSGCVVSEASPFPPGRTAEIDEVLGAAVDDLAAGVLELRLDGLDSDLAARFDRAAAGDRDEAFVLVADGVLWFLADDGRIVSSTPAVDRAIEDADVIDRRVTGALVLVVDPPVGCPTR